MTPDELAAIKAAPGAATFRDVLALVAEVERLHALIYAAEAAVGESEGIGVGRYLDLAGAHDAVRDWNDVVSD